MQSSFYCCHCDVPISDGVASYSFGRFGRELCMNCQKAARFKDSPKKLTRIINKWVDRKYKGSDKK